MRTKQLYFLIPLLLVSCTRHNSVSAIVDDNEEPEPATQVAISFASETADASEVTTRATLNTKLERDFQLYGFKKSATYTQTVFNNYTLKYASGSAGTSTDNTHGYYYVGLGSQTIKYWDYSAAQYDFFAVSAPSNSATLTATDTQMTGDAWSEGQTMSYTLTVDSKNTTDNTLPLYTELQTLTSGSYGQVVTMEFKRPVVQVGYRFVASAGIDMTTSVLISQSSFAPTNQGDIIYSAGNVTVTYANTGATVALSTDEATQFTDSIKSEDGQSSTEFENQMVHTITEMSNNYYTLMPAPTNGYGPFTLTATINGSQKTATVPAEYMQWRPNCRYTYIFKITEITLNLVLIKVDVDSWTDGGYIEDEQTQW